MNKVSEGNSFSHFDPNLGSQLFEDSVTKTQMIYLGHLTSNKCLVYSPDSMEFHQIPVTNLTPISKISIELLEKHLSNIISCISQGASNLNTYSQETANKASEFFSKKAVTRNGNPSRDSEIENKFPDELQSN